jgi:hypothetical protein
MPEIRNSALDENSITHGMQDVEGTFISKVLVMEAAGVF